MNSRPKVIMSSRDVERLESLLDSLPHGAFPGKDDLQAELERAEIVDPEDVPRDVITMNSTVRFHVESSAEQFTLGKVDLFDVAALKHARVMLDYDLLLWGSPTWEKGGLQKDWEKLCDRLNGLDLNGRPVAVFGLGGQVGYAHEFVDAMRILHDKALGLGARMIGYWSDEGYDYDASAAVLDGFVCGLALDEENQGHLSEARIDRRCYQLQAELELWPNWAPGPS